MKKLLLVASVMGVMMFSGCSSDTKESLKTEYSELLMKCFSGKYDKTECKEKGQDLGKRAKAIGMSYRDLIQ
jgi:outer membrane murein-binding lipoprotein Lpp